MLEDVSPARGHQNLPELCFPQLDEVYTLLRDNYVEDDGASFRFDYSKNFLHWCVL
jgi:hypothetical protein